MKNQFELLAPGGDIDSIKAAIVAGADAIYCGLDHFNARTRAANISFDDLNGILRLAHKNNCQIFLTLNIIILESELPALIRLLNELVNTGIDGVIVQDLGLFYILSRYYKTLDVHASTQVTTHNEGQILFLNKLGAGRTNLSRELNIDEIKQLTNVSHQNDMMTEVFVHGSNCIGFSGLCYISSAHGGNSGNRGRCSQPCRDQYQTTRAGKDFPLNLKDNSAFSDIAALGEAGVDSLKIEGRIKKFDYVYTVVSSWREQIQSYSQHKSIKSENEDLYKVFNRDFTNAYLKGDINKHMFIDNPRGNSVQHFTAIKGYNTEAEVQSVKQSLYDEKTVLIQSVKEKIKDLNIGKTPLIISFSGELDTPLTVSVQTQEKKFTVHSDTNLFQGGKYTLDDADIKQRFKSLNNAKYQITAFNTEGLDSDLFLAFKELTALKNRIEYHLNGEQASIKPITLDKLTKRRQVAKAKLSVLISSTKDLNLCDTSDAEIYYQLPDCIESQYSQLIELFSANERLIPWFPAILIGENYRAGVKLLKAIKPKLIVTNNTGIAHAAFENRINWIAGPYLNITNSYSLLAMKEEFNCYGSFISNEINKKQIKHIAGTDDMKLYYSIYHPILLLTSRQCLFHQTTGCHKESMDADCLNECKKSVSIVNLKETAFVIDKQMGEHNNMYGSQHFLNTEIVSDIPDMFSSFFVDLRGIRTNTRSGRDKSKLVQLFKDLLDGQLDAETELHQLIGHVTDTQYRKGL
ncbi:peptidase U32 family protein [Shewanella atlantica]|uniref:U32 family peptidase n=1 Tax=Shewanella atlantica TaxID=271099 RepID=A0A431WCK4_9GAMM|nr:peptidase U32 family protein [Shewanella atlantica]RTR33246.1 U32 family peptidase [Shewanella atlantica]